MKRTVLTGLLLLVTLVSEAQESAPEVMLLGVFHFANPRQDVVQTDQIDVSTRENQEYLDGLALRLCAFRPTTILVEIEPEREPLLLSQLQDYVAGREELAINERQQIGFRVAKACGVVNLRGFDHDDVGWRGDVLFEYLEASAPDQLDELNEEIARFEREATSAHRDLSLRELLIQANHPEEDRANKDFYLLTNSVGVGEGFEGADATAGWWHRNFRMYAIIQSYATEGERVLVIAGQGHTAILRDLLRIDRRISERDIFEYL